MNKFFDNVQQCRLRHWHGAVRLS